MKSRYIKGVLVLFFSFPPIAVEEVVAVEQVDVVTHIMIGGMTEDMTDMKNMTTDTGT